MIPQEYIDDLSSSKKSKSRKLALDKLAYILEKWDFGPDRVEALFGIPKYTASRIKSGRREIRFKTLQEKVIPGLLDKRFSRLFDDWERSILYALEDPKKIKLYSSDKKDQDEIDKLRESILYDYLLSSRNDICCRVCVLMSRKGVATKQLLFSEFERDEAIEIANELVVCGVAEFCNKSDSYNLLCNFDVSKLPSLEKKLFNDLVRSRLNHDDSDLYDVHNRYFVGFVTLEDYRELAGNWKLSFDKRLELTKASELKEGADIPIFALDSVIPVAGRYLKREFEEQADDFTIKDNQQEEIQ